MEFINSEDIISGLNSGDKLTEEDMAGAYSVGFRESGELVAVFPYRIFEAGGKSCASIHAGIRRDLRGSAGIKYGKIAVRSLMILYDRVICQIVPSERHVIFYAKACGGKFLTKENGFYVFEF